MIDYATTERFMRYVRLGPNCWEWTGAKAHGYGRFHVKGRGLLAAHRFAWEVFHGTRVGPDRMVLHHCDNPSCVRPSHHFLGDDAANSNDKLRKGRGARGSTHGMAKLSGGQIVAARKRHFYGGERLTDLAREYGVHQATLSEALRGLKWRHLGGPRAPQRWADTHRDIFIRLDKLRARWAGRTPILGILETPGPGKRPRRLVVIEEADWIALHGPAPEL